MRTIISARVMGDWLYEFSENPDLTKLPEGTVIVCLAGGKKRVETAFTLFSQGIGSRLLIVGAGPKSSLTGLAKTHAPEAMAKISEERMAAAQVETDSRNTIENAFAVDTFLHKNPEVKAILLVTSAYHMRRAQLLIELQSKRSIKVIPYKPANEAIDLGNWWQSGLGIELTMLEYFKLQLARVLVPRLDFL